MRGVAPPRPRAAQAGISLVETLVALVLGLAMVSVAFNLYVSNSAMFRQIEAMVRLQESASIAAALLERSIRHAGGTLCRNNLPLTPLLNDGSYENYWAPSKPYGLEGVHAYESEDANRPDLIVGALRLAGDSISITSDNMEDVARVTESATYSARSGTRAGTYTFTVDDASKFPRGTVALACDYVRAVLFQVTASTPKTITLVSGTTTPSPGNCGVLMRRPSSPGEPIQGLDGDFYRCTVDGEYPYEGQVYPFGPGSMIGTHTFHHWYIGKKASTDACCSLRRRRATYSSAGVGSTDEEIVENVTDMQITVLPGLLNTGYPFSYWYVNAKALFEERFIDSFQRVTAVRIVLTLTSPEKVGLAAQNKASAATYTIPINVAIRARMPGVVRR